MKHDQQNCSGCSHEESCRQMYERIGRVEGPGVLGTVIWAFVVPIFVFVGALVAANALLGDRLDDKMLTVVGFLLAAAVTVIVVFIIRAVRRPSKHDKTR